MRYIGSKLNLLRQLDEAINECNVSTGKFCDIFSGTGVVGRHFKNNFQITSNDFLYFSHVLQHASICLNKTPDLTKIEKIFGDPFLYLNNIDITKFDFKKPAFIAIEYSPHQGGERKYFRENSALHIDAIRQTIQDWFENGLIDEDGFKYLLASLIEFVPSISNIAGTYGAYLKHWDTRTTKPMALAPIQLIDNNLENISFNEDANELIKKISGDVLYVDPPYNGRQYLGNYHVLETIAKYDSPILKGKTGTREDLGKSSNYCKKGKVAGAFSELVENAKFKNIFISYSTEGLLEVDELVNIVENSTDKRFLKVYKFPYRRYVRIKDENKPTVDEIVISAVK